MNKQVQEFIQDLQHGPCASVPLEEYEKHIRKTANQIAKQHGGKRANAGRKPSPYPTQLLKIKCTREELAEILKLTTRERAKCLLAMTSEL